MAKATKNAAKISKATSKAQGANGKAKAQKSVKAAKAPQKAAQTTPYRLGSSYQAIVDALRNLGIGKIHPFEAIIGKVELPSGFKGREKRNDETGKGWKDRIVQNCRVIARKDYGEPLRKTAYEVRTDGAKGCGLFKLGK